ncbi:hypothetical protein KIW84_023051 [Lathyrus oleraceus]|uniref:Uncharacterized protein n=1 Tax=Pisum sativum TaxID=3888 RepID=A0A9D4YFV9_PEA|nr:hypothetical protein KIW84_023051 [Pisum sativum]
MGREHIVEEDYIVDELDSGADEDSNDDRLAMIMFNKEEALIKDFTFKDGMEFSSLKQPGPGLQPWFERCYVCFDGTEK